MHEVTSTYNLSEDRLPFLMTQILKQLITEISFTSEVAHLYVKFLLFTGCAPCDDNFESFLTSPWLHRIFCKAET
jgi:hypothetical protein